jgi:hypothetical protein
MKTFLMRSIGAAGAFRAVSMIVLWFTSATASAANICWIDHVARVPNGMTLVFSTDANLLFKVTHQNDQRVSFYVTKGVVQSGQEGRNNNVVLNNGDVAFLMQSPEDSCDLVAVIQDEKLGVLVHAVSTMSPYGRSTASTFIPAE